jgi:NAD(P)-dependent dehydrogenase (short-subunit alcohol dehydrogenase family)
MKELKNKTALVTGGASGIGYACAEIFARAGAKVWIADANAEAGSKAARKLKAEFVACDVGDAKQANALLDAVARGAKRLDVLVNNAGIAPSKPFLDMTEDDWDRVIRVNLKGAFLVGQAAARLMVAKKTQGAIVNMSSVNAVLAIPGLAAYNVSKGGINQLTRVMALELAPHGIRVNAIGPGTIATELARKAVLGSPEAKTKIMSRTPMGRLGEPEEIAELALFLASKRSSYMTGQIVYADGGRLPLNYTVPVKG